MPRLTPVKSRLLIRYLQKTGFVAVRQKGSHIFFAHPDGRTTVIPYHPTEEIRPALLRKILHDTKISPEGFLKTK